MPNFMLMRTTPVELDAEAVPFIVDALRGRVAELEENSVEYARRFDGTYDPDHHAALHHERILLGLSADRLERAMKEHA